VIKHDLANVLDPDGSSTFVSSISIPVVPMRATGTALGRAVDALNLIPHACAWRAGNPEDAGDQIRITSKAVSDIDFARRIAFKIRDKGIEIVSKST